MRDFSLQIAENPTQLAELACDAVIDCAQRAIDERGSFHLALAGGSTPRRLYEKLATRLNDSVLPHCHFYFGDERCVPPEHPDSNFGMVKQAWFAHSNIDAEQIHRIHAELEPEAAVSDYLDVLQQYLPLDEHSMGVFDLVLLGMGADGHTASLFPATSALLEEREWAVAVYVEQLSTWRITLSYPLINNAREIYILAAGQNKAPVIGEILSGKGEAYPINGIHAREHLCWFIDAAAASALKETS